MAAGGNNFKGWIWPRDGRPGQSWKHNRWTSLRDVLTGKGPDIYVGRLDKDPHRPSKDRWSNWGHVFDTIPPDEVFNQVHPLFNASRTNQVYDFRSRRYRNYDGPFSGMWSDRARCPNKYAKMPHSYRDASGTRYDMSAHHWDPFMMEETCWRPYHG